MKNHISICAVTVILFSSYALAGTWTTLDYPGAQNTDVSGISGNSIVGHCFDSSWGSSGSDNSQGFLYNGTSWTTLDYPGAQATAAVGISGNNIVGRYINSDNDESHGFLYNATTQSWTTLDYPGANETWANDIDGSNIVGFYENATGYHGFLYNGKTWTTLNMAGALDTDATGISGNNIVGFYEDTSGTLHGYTYTIPEPATLLLLGLGTVVLRKKR